MTTFFYCLFNYLYSWVDLLGEWLTHTFLKGWPIGGPAWIELLWPCRDFNHRSGSLAIFFSLRVIILVFLGS